MGKTVINFRAWDGKRMYHFNLQDLFNEGLEVNLKKLDSKHLSINTQLPYHGMPLMQFTGLQDIANTDCYEDDIIKAVWSEDINDKIFGIGRVVFNCGCFMIEWIDDKEANMELLGMIYKTGRPRVFQIIGNIHQTPDLL